MKPSDDQRRVYADLGTNRNGNLGGRPHGGGGSRREYAASPEAGTRQQGSPGVDGMTVEELPEHLKVEWPRLKQELLEGEDKPRR